MLNHTQLPYFILLAYIAVPANYIDHNLLFIYLFVIGLLFVNKKIKFDHFLLITPIIGIIFLTFFALVYDIHATVWRDVFELPKFFLLIFFVLIGAQLPREFTYYELMIVPLLFFFSVGIIEVLFFDKIFAVRSFYVRTDGLYFFKPINFWYTTYFSGFMYLFFSLVCMENFTKRNSTLSIILSFFFIFLAIFTQSRIIFLISALFLFVCFLVASKRRPSSVLTVVICCSVAAINFLDLDELFKFFSYLAYGLENYIWKFSENYTGSNSLGARVAQIQFSLQYNNILLFGAGIGKGYNEYLESLYALYLYRYGLLGLLLYITFWMLIPMIRCRCVTDFFWHILFIVLLSVGGLSSVMTDQFFIMPWLGMYIGHKFSKTFPTRRIHSRNMNVAAKENAGVKTFGRQS